MEKNPISITLAEPFESNTLVIRKELRQVVAENGTDAQRKLRKYIAIEIAGHIATDVMNPGNRDFEVPYDPNYLYDEIACAMALSELLTNGIDDYRKIVEWTKDVIKQNHVAVTKMANDLMEKTTINGSDIDIEVTRLELDAVFPST